MAEKKFAVYGMSCSACALGVEKAVKRVKGVKTAEVSLMGKSMRVIYDETVVNDDDIIFAVKRIGYTACEYGKKEEDEQKKGNGARIRFIVSAVLLIIELYFGMGKMAGFPLPVPKINLSVQFALCSAVMIINYRLFVSGVKSIIKGVPNMDSLVSLGAISAYLYSVVLTIMTLVGSKENPAVFYEGACMVLTFVTLGKWLEDVCKKKTGNAVEKLGEMLPERAIVIRDGKEVSVRASEINEGDSVLFRTGDRLCVDGTVISGSAGMDKSALTGESMIDEVSVGSAVYSGSIVASGSVTVRADKVGEGTVFSGIIELVKTASTSKAPISRTADKIAGIFVPVVTTVALLVFVVWIIATKDFYTALSRGISVLVVSCPCALGLATPVAIVACSGRGAREGILFKNAESIETCAKTDVVLLDKTATLTEGKPLVRDVRYYAVEKQFADSIAFALEKVSSHPLAECLKKYCGYAQNDNIETGECEEYAGRGVIGVANGKKYYLGSLKGVPEKVREKLDSPKIGATVICLCDEENPLAEYYVADEIKPDAKQTISSLKSMKILPVMVTGDRDGVAKDVCAKIGIEEYRAEVLPQDKAEAVEHYKKQNRKVAMVGDGINDSPALNVADVGVAVGNGTDVAISCADVVITGERASAISGAFSIARKTLRIIKENLFWAFLYNLLAIPSAGGVFSALGFSLSPSVSAICMSASSLIVVLNALRITFVGKKKGETEESAETKLDAKTESNYNNENNNDGNNVENGEKGVKSKMKAEERKLVLKIEGMACAHCTARVEKAVSVVGGVTSVKADSDKGEAVVTGSADENLIRTAIENEGYKVVSLRVL